MPEHPGDIEHPVVLPAQPREHARVLRGTVRRVTRPWAGLALPFVAIGAQDGPRPFNPEETTNG